MPETAKKRTARPKVEAVPEPQMDAADEVAHAGPDTSADAHEPVACPVAWCPICMAVTAVQPLRPDVVEHLLKAGTELLLAFRGVIDARADELDPSADDAVPTRLEKIDLG
jgi:hypothetical protein